MEKCKNKTVKEFIELLKTLPQEEKIGVLRYSDGEVFGSNDITIHEWDSEIIAMDDDVCKYYIY